MGLFNKLKNVLFEEEVVEVPIEEPVKKEPKKEPEEKVLERKRSVIEQNPKKEEPPKKEKDTFKAEKTFDFPVFDEEEFDDVKRVSTPPKKEEPKKNSMSINLFDYDKPKMPPKKEKVGKKVAAEEIKGRAYEAKEKEFDARKFKPSPVISPVYGVLDKNYTKEEISIKKEAKKALDVDEARKKAFGPLEQEITNNMDRNPKEERKKRRYEPEYEEEKSIDDLLEETAFDTIEIPTEYEDEKRKFPEREEYELERLDKKRKPKTEEEIIDSDDTLESDLFDLIDSMYENREDD